MYEVLIEKSAEKELNSINSPYFDKIVKAIMGLAMDPRPENCKKLKGIEGLWRIRIADYRIVYIIDDKLQEVKVERIGHRSNVYN